MTGASGFANVSPLSARLQLPAAMSAGRPIGGQQDGGSQTIALQADLLLRNPTPRCPTKATAGAEHGYRRNQNGERALRIVNSSTMRILLSSGRRGLAAIRLVCEGAAEEFVVQPCSLSPGQRWRRADRLSAGPAP